MGIFELKQILVVLGIGVPTILGVWWWMAQSCSAAQWFRAANYFYETERRWLRLRAGEESPEDDEDRWIMAMNWREFGVAVRDLYWQHYNSRRIGVEKMLYYAEYARYSTKATTGDMVKSIGKTMRFDQIGADIDPLPYSEHSEVAYTDNQGVTKATLSPRGGA